MTMTRMLAFLAGLALAAAAHAAPTVQSFGVRINGGASVQPGNVLFVDCATANPDATAQAFLVDQTGHIIHTWKKGSFRWLAKPNGTDGSVIAMHRADAKAGDLLGSCAAPTGVLQLSRIGWDDAVTNIYHDPACFLTHDFEVIGDGTYLILCQQIVTNPSVSTQPFLDDIIRRVDSAGNVMWSWSTAAHYAQFNLSDAGKQTIMAGQTYYASSNPSYPSSDVFHTNSIQFIPPNASAASNPAFSPGNIMVSQRNTNLIFVIDYNSGNVVWQTNSITIGQHTPRVIHANLPGDGHILVLNNGGIGGYPPQYAFGSSVEEYNPITSTMAWQWTQTPATADGTGNPIENYAFQTYYRGSTQRLPNGNTFIDESVWGRFIEVDPTGKIVWEYVWKFGNPIGAAPNAPDRRIYRAYKVASCWPGCNADSTSAGGSWSW